MTKSQKIALVTFGVFMTEAFLHYNVGVNSGREEKKIQFPPTKDLLQIGLIVGGFSILNGYIIKKYIK